MEQPIRYYITKQGDEPTVRSVKVAREVIHTPDRVETETRSANVSSPEVSGRRADVKRLVQGAIRGRVPGA